MSEPRTPNPSPSNKPAGRRKRSAKVKASPGASDAPPDPVQDVAPAPGRKAGVSLSTLDREAMIRTAAYFRAQKRRFASGHELEDWVAAESEIDAALLQGSDSTGLISGSGDQQ